jgi:hypothetical protein
MDEPRRQQGSPLNWSNALRNVREASGFSVSKLVGELNSKKELFDEKTWERWENGETSPPDVEKGEVIANFAAEVRERAGRDGKRFAEQLNLLLMQARIEHGKSKRTRRNHTDILVKGDASSGRVTPKASGDEREFNGEVRPTAAGSKWPKPPLPAVAGILVVAVVALVAGGAVAELLDHSTEERKVVAEPTAAATPAASATPPPYTDESAGGAVPLSMALPPCDFKRTVQPDRIIGFTATIDDPGHCSTRLAAGSPESLLGDTAAIWTGANCGSSSSHRTLGTIRRARLARPVRRSPQKRPTDRGTRRFSSVRKAIRRRNSTSY